MEKSFAKIIRGYKAFREKYVLGEKSIMQHLSIYGQKPEIMVIACSDSRVDPALILQCDPGDLFIVRNVANIVPPYKKDQVNYATGAALEFGIRLLGIKHLILLGHSQCGGIDALFSQNNTENNDFITNWVSIVKASDAHVNSVDDYAKIALKQSYQNCMGFPWIAEKVMKKILLIHLWFFDIKTGQIFFFSHIHNEYRAFDSENF